MRAIGDEAAVELFVLDDSVVGVVLDPWGSLAISAGRSGLRVPLNADELRDLAARFLAAEVVDVVPRPSPGVGFGHA